MIRVNPSDDRRSRQRRERRQSFAKSIGKAQKRALGPATTRQTPLQIQGRGIELDDTIRNYIRRHVGFKLGKFGLRVLRLSVAIENVAGTKGAPAYHCRFRVIVPGMPAVVVTEEQETVRAAFDTAADTTERVVRRRLGRVRATRHRRQQPHSSTPASF